MHSIKICTIVTPFFKVNFCGTYLVKTNQLHSFLWYVATYQINHGWYGTFEINHGWPWFISNVP